MAILFYGLIPVTGAFIERRRWRLFRRRFNELRRKPHLDYNILTRPIEPDDTLLNAGFIDDNPVVDEYRFYGTLESTGSDTLWIRSDSLTVQADLGEAEIYLFPNKGGKKNNDAFDPGEQAPERIRWDRISTLAGDAKVYVGGPLIEKDRRRIFASLSGFPLLIILYEGSEKALAVTVVRAGRHRNEFFNFLSPFSFVLGAFSQLIIAVSLLARPVQRLTMISAFIALFTLLIPWIPPGLIFTMLYRNLWWRARLYRSYRDMARFPTQYFSSGEFRAALPNGEIYMQKSYDTLPSWIYEKLPFLIPASEKRKKTEWHVFGSLLEGQDDNSFPAEPADEFAISCVLPGESEALARLYTRKAYFLEIISWLFLLAGLGINVFFISLILIQLGI